MNPALSIVIGWLVMGWGGVLVFSTPSLARIAPGSNNQCPPPLVFDQQSGRCQRPGESYPALGGKNDPSSRLENQQKLSGKFTNEASEVCSQIPGTIPKQITGGFICLPGQGSSSSKP